MNGSTNMKFRQRVTGNEITIKNILEKQRHSLEICHTTKAPFPSLACLSSNKRILKKLSCQIKVS